MMFHTGVAVITYNLLMREIPPGVRDLGSPMITRVTSAVRMLPGRAGVFIAVTGFFSLQMEVLVGKSRDFFQQALLLEGPTIELSFESVCRQRWAQISLDDPSLVWFCVRAFHQEMPGFWSV